MHTRIVLCAAGVVTVQGRASVWSGSGAKSRYALLHLTGGEHFAFSDACTNFRKAPFGFVMSIYIEQLGCYWTEFD